MCDTYFFGILYCPGGACLVSCVSMLEQRTAKLTLNSVLDVLNFKISIFLILNDDSDVRTPSLEKVNFVSHRFFILSSIGTQLTSKNPYSDPVL